MAGGPPVRGDLLPFWEPAGLGWEDGQRCRAAARRIAAGVRELAHQDAEVDAGAHVVVFPCVGPGTAARWARAIAAEQVEARIVVDRTGVSGVALPCRPDATDEEIRHAVLACLKAAHSGA